MIEFNNKVHVSNLLLAAMGVDYKRFYHEPHEPTRTEDGYPIYSGIMSHNDTWKKW